MKQSLNTPYRTSSGIEITKDQPFINQGQNRKSRRHKEPPFIGNGKQIPLTVSGTSKYLRMVQRVPLRMIAGILKGGNSILHYISK